MDDPGLSITPWWVQFLKFYGLPAVLLVAVLWRVDVYLDRIITDLNDRYALMGKSMLEQVSAQKALQEELVESFKREQDYLERIVNALEND